MSVELQPELVLDVPTQDADAAACQLYESTIERMRSLVGAWDQLQMAEASPDRQSTWVIQMDCYSGHSDSLTLYAKFCHEGVHWVSNPRYASRYDNEADAQRMVLGSHLGIHVQNVATHDAARTVA